MVWLLDILADGAGLCRMVRDIITHEGDVRVRPAYCMKSSALAYERAGLRYGRAH
jgi:hypothetical protein